MRHGSFIFHRWAAIAAAAFLLWGGRMEASGGVPSTEPSPNLATLGSKIFFDKSLSQSGGLACASCHSPTHAYGPPNALAVQLGGPALDQQGARAVPSLRYVLNRTPIWGTEFNSNQAERLMMGEEQISGGFGWDGRFGSLHEQVEFPLMAPNEMANRAPADVVEKLRRAPYADDFRKVFGEQVFDDPAKTFADLSLAVERFELESPSFHPFSSKYDDYLDGKIHLTAQETRGQTLFDDPQRGNCASCHLDRKGADGSHPLFTDYQFEALGVPRNPEILANADPTYFDQGLCGPGRQDMRKVPQFCGLFKTPTLRNVATRAVFFHNGRFHTLKDALRFYVQRDTNPEQWYPVLPDRSVDKFNDVRPRLRGNVDVVDEPLTRSAGGKPAWSDAEIEDVIAFLKTLTDRDAEAVPPPPK